MRSFFAGLDEKHNLLESFEKIFIRILLKCIIFAYFSKKFSKPCVNFSRVWTKNANCWEILKIFDETSIEKLNFYFIFIFMLENLLLKIEPSEITPFFYHNFFRFGGGDFPSSPCLRPLKSWRRQWHIRYD